MNRYGGRVQPIETGALPSVDVFSGDDSTTVFALSYEAASDQAVTVLISGITQQVDAYSVSGTTLTFVDAPVTGTDNIEVRIVSQVGKSTVPQDSSVTTNKTTGMQNVIQIVNLSDGALNSGTATFPLDNTIPQNTEGTEFMSLAITPRDINNILVIEAMARQRLSVDASQVGALFQDAIVDALAATSTWPRSGGATFLTLKHYMVAGTTSPITFKWRGGGANSSTCSFNSANSTGAGFGGVSNSYMTITEYKP